LQPFEHRPRRAIGEERLGVGRSETGAEQLPPRPGFERVDQARRVAEAPARGKRLDLQREDAIGIRPAGLERDARAGVGRTVMTHDRIGPR
jgi:hypothetical protein